MGQSLEKVHEHRVAKIGLDITFGWFVLLEILSLGLEKDPYHLQYICTVLQILLLLLKVPKHQHLFPVWCEIWKFKSRTNLFFFCQRNSFNWFRVFKREIFWFIKWNFNSFGFWSPYAKINTIWLWKSSKVKSIKYFLQRKSIEKSPTHFENLPFSSAVHNTIQL